MRSASDEDVAVLRDELLNGHWLPPADLRSKRIRSSENSFLQFDCDCSAVLFEKSIAGLAKRFCEGIDVRLLIRNIPTMDANEALCDFRNVMIGRISKQLGLSSMYSGLCD